MICKALFQLLIIVTSLFTVSSLAPPVAEAQQQVCCQETISGEHCQYTDQSNCKPGALQASTSCDQTSFCQLGCGFNTQSGRCFKSTPKSSCEAQGANCTWSPSPSCDIPQCQKGCCVLSNQCSFVTQLQCKQVTSQFQSLNATFDESITDEFTCINQCRSFERGACVQPDGSCVFTTRNACSQQTSLQPNATGPQVGFHPDRLCSNPQLGTECAAQQYTGCLPGEDEVYWYDSCGNPENIYSDDKRASYNNGFVLSKEQSCNPGRNNVNSPSCGNCDFSLGTLCGKAPKNVNPTFGDYTCVDLSCNQITVSATSPASQSGTKKLGESWCAYDGVPGFGRDFVGSRHYRRLCINGQELTEPCKDFREEICVQGVQGQPPLGTQAAFQLAQGNYVEAVCRTNRHSTCGDVENQGDCENLQLRDCYWVGERKATEEEAKENEDGKCVPLVSPGLKFWPDESQTPTSTLDPKSTCEAGSNECTVTFQRPGLFGDPIRGNVGRDWECVSNCKCLEKEYLQAMNNACKSLGDCGAWFNIKGKFTEDGFVEDSEQELTEADVESYDSLVSPSAGRSDYDNKFSAFFKQAAPGLAVIGVTGGIVLLGGGGFSYFTIGVVNIFETVKGGFTGIFGAGEGAVSWIGKLFQGISTGLGVPKTQFAAVTETATQKGVEAASTSLAKTAIIEPGTTVMLAPGTYTLPQSALSQLPKTIQSTAQQALAGPEAPWIVEIPASHGPVSIVAPEIGTLAGQEGMTAVPPFDVLGFINTIAWLYTIYSLLDILFADTKTEVITVSCEPWQAPSGGADCESCTEEGKECSEYRCRSLGQLCKLLNAGTEEEACVNTNPNDASSPIISADPSALNKGHTLTEVKGKGYSVNEKILPFTPVSLGIVTDEYATCKFSLDPKETYDEVTNTFGSGLYAKEHQMTFSLPSVLAQQQALQLTNGGSYTLYTRCEDGNGNENNQPYYIKFAIQPGPDITAPVIETTSIANGAFVQAGANSTVLTIYVNEPSSCNWDDIDTEFELMNNQFACSSSQAPTTSLYYGLYDCTTVLAGIQANVVSNYFFRCQDVVGNVNSESYPYTLRGTIPLAINSISPLPGTAFFTPDVTVKVVTSKGAQGGVAVCGYSFTDPNPNSAIEFLQTNSSTHEQQFQNLLAGSYTTYISCFDVAGNLAQGNTTFTVSVDTQGPRITNIYTQGNILHLSMNEPSDCEFSTTGSFSFGQGTPMTGAGTKEHETTLDSNLYYIVCQDNFANEASYKIFV